MSNKIKEQLVNLALELEDKEKITVLLERKIAQERDRLKNSEEEVNITYSRIIEDEIERNKSEAEKWNRMSQEAMSEKSDLIEKCKLLMEDIKQVELDTQAEVRRIYREGEQSIEAEKRRFKLGYEERLTKFLAQKTQEYRESTGRALEPEVNRLETNYERELSVINQQYEMDEYKLKEEYQLDLQKDMEEEKIQAKADMQNGLKTLQEKYTAEIDQIQYEEKYKLKLLQEKLEKENERYQKQSNDKWKRYQQQLHEETIELQETSHQRIIQFQKKHYAQLEQLHQEHEDVIDSLKKQQLEEVRKLERATTSSSNHYSDSDNDNNSRRGNGGDDNENGNENEKEALPRKYSPPSPMRYSSSLSPRKSSKSTGTPSPTKGKLSKTTRKSKSGSNEASVMQEIEEEIAQFSEEFQQKLLSLRTEQETLRDKRLQQDIRFYERQFFDQEQEYKKRYEQEYKKLSSLQQIEESKLSSKQQNFTEGYSHAILEREECLQRLKTLAQQIETLENESKSLEKECTLFKQGIEALKTQIQEKEEEKKRSLREYTLQYTPLLREAAQEQESIQFKIEQYEQAWQAGMKEKELEHTKALAALDAKVKADVSQRDETLHHFRECIQEEQLAIEKLAILVQKYNSTSTGAATLDQEGTGLHVLGEEKRDTTYTYGHSNNTRSVSSQRRGYSSNNNSSSSVAASRLSYQRERDRGDIVAGGDRDARSVRSGSTISTATQHTASSNNNSNNNRILSRHAKLNYTTSAMNK